jgi:hypothetical protein
MDQTFVVIADICCYQSRGNGANQSTFYYKRHMETYANGSRYKINFAQLTLLIRQEIQFINIALISTHYSCKI